MQPQAKQSPQSAYVWSGKRGYRNDLWWAALIGRPKNRAREIPLRVALRDLIVMDLREHGESPVEELRARVLNDAALDVTDAYHTNQHSWALVDLQRQGKIEKVGARRHLARYRLTA